MRYSGRVKTMALVTKGCWADIGAGDHTCSRGPEPPHVDVTAGKTGCPPFQTITKMAYHLQVLVVSAERDAVDLL
jgi:hypothetical protein